MNSAHSKLTSPPNPADSIATVSGLGTTSETTGGAGMTNVIPRTVSEKAKQIEREMLMERIRLRAGQQRSFPELARAMRMAMLEKRYALDAVEKSNLQKSLERLQKHIKVKTRSGLVERLENLSKQLGMKFMEDAAGLFISTDMFYLEIILDANGKLTDVKVHHECKIEQTSCKELVDCLNNGDFADFTAQLEGLSAIYQLNAEPKVKTKAFVALQAMETDLLKLYQWQSNSNKETLQKVAESCVGIVLPRRGGHAMRLTYFVSPYDFINLETQNIEDPGVEGINAKQLGLSVTVNLEASSANKLQILPTVSFAKDMLTGVENGQPLYAPLSQANSMLLPATFVLRLSKPLPVCCNALQKLLPHNVQSISQANQNSTSEASSNMNLINLIVQTALDQQCKGAPQKGLFVNLPDSTHCYFFTEHKEMKGTLLTSVPFTEPCQVPKIIGFLKRQALFYTLLTSCVRPQSRMGHDMDSTVILEINAISVEKIAVSLQHPYEDSLATVEFDLSDGRGKIQCSIYSLYADYTEASRKMSLVVQKSLSIPVTIRAILRYWDKERLEMFQKNIGPTTSSGGGGGLLAQAAYGLSMSSHMSMGGDILTDTTASGSANTTRTYTLSSGGVNATGASGAIAGYLKYKQEPVGANSIPAIKSEDFTDHGQMSTAIAASSVLSAGAMTAPSPSSVQSPPSTPLAPVSQIMSSATSLSQLNKASEMEIADKYKNIWKDKTPNLKSGHLSITAIGATDATNKSMSTAIPSQTANLDVKRTGGIEIIPLTSGNQQISMQNQAMPALTTMAATATSTPHSTITITPINTAVHSSVTPSPSSGAITMTSSNPNVATTTALPMSLKRPAGNDADATLSSSSNSSTSSNSSLTSSTAPPKEKKRKKKRDDSPMGPPEKVYSRQNSPSSSPVGAGGSSVANAALSTRPSPKHSPVYSSPKHTNTASNSPKSPFGTHSPKHGSSGKPSMSTLKSASSAVGAVTSVAAAVNMKSRDKEKPPAISTAATLGGSLPTTATATGGISGLMAPTIASKSPHLGLGGITSSVGMASAQSVSSLPQQLKSVASLNQYLSSYGAGGGNSPSTMAPSLSSSSDMASASIAAASAAALALRKSQSIPPPPPPPLNMSSACPGGNSGISAGGAGAAVSLMTSQQTQQHHQQFQQRQQQQRPQLQQQQQVPSQLPLCHGSEQDKFLPLYKSSKQMVNVGDALEGSDIGPLNIGSSHETFSTSSSSGTEYMVKSSQEGLKLTINKTTSTTSSGVVSKSTFPSTATSSPSTMLTATTPSPKRHTGLKPGVLSGPASKKGRTSPNSSSSSASSSPQSASPQSTTSSSSISNKSPLMATSTRSTMHSNENIMRLMQYAAAATTTTFALAKQLTSSTATATTNTSQNMSGIEDLLGAKSSAITFQIPKLTQRPGSNISAVTTTSDAISSVNSSMPAIGSRNIQFPVLQSPALTQESQGNLPMQSYVGFSSSTCRSATTTTVASQQQHRESASTSVSSAFNSSVLSATSSSETGNESNKSSNSNLNENPK